MSNLTEKQLCIESGRDGGEGSSDLNFSLDSRTMRGGSFLLENGSAKNNI